MRVERPVRHRVYGVSMVSVELVTYVSSRDGPAEMGEVRDELMGLLSELSDSERNHN